MVDKFKKKSISNSVKNKIRRIVEPRKLKINSIVLKKVSKEIVANPNITLNNNGNIANNE